MKKPWKYVEVDWADAVSSLKWADNGKFPSPQTFTTRGWLVFETLDHIVLAGTVGWDIDLWIYGEVISLPRGCIEHITPLETVPTPAQFDVSKGDA